MNLNVNSIRWDGTGEPATEGRNLEPAPKLLDEETIGKDGGKGQRIGLKKRRTTEKPVRDHNMFGDRMAGSNDEISSELPTRTGPVFMLESAEEPAEGSQSVRSSWEAGNDRGAKGRREVET
jgi:hypothetical protein